MHGSSLCRMQWFVETFVTPLAKPLQVLDVGSCEVAGGTYKSFFPASEYDYKGLDLCAGPNVDIVPRYPYHWEELSDNCFDIVISGQAFEHIEFFWLTAQEMARVLRPGGLMCILAPRGFERHRYPVDCYRFDMDGMNAIAKWCNLEVIHASTDMEPMDAGPGWHIEQCEDSLLIARKPMDWLGPLAWQSYTLAGKPIEEPEGFRRCAKIEPPETIETYVHERIKIKLERSLEEKNKKIASLEQLIGEYENSNSWRITRPLRALRKIWRSLTRKC